MTAERSGECKAGAELIPLRLFLCDGAELPHWERRETALGPVWYRHLPEKLFCTSAVALWSQSAAPLLRLGVLLDDAATGFHQHLYPDGPKRFRIRDVDRDRLDAIERKARRVALPDIDPELEAKLLVYQRPAARLLSRALAAGRDEWGYPGALDCSDMGTGKTYATIAAAATTGRQIGVICPKVGHPGWVEAFDHFGIRPRFIQNYEALRTGKRKTIARRDFDGIRWASPENLVLIFDEAHKMRHADTLNFTLGQGAARQGIPIIAASATIAISPVEMGFSGMISGLHDGSTADFERFLAASGCARDGDKWRLVSQHGLVRISETIFPDRGVRVRIADLGDLFPKTSIDILPLHIPEAARVNKMFQEALETARNLERQHGRQQWIKNTAGQAYIRAWHAVERLMVPAVCDVAKRELSEGRSVALFCNFTDTREAIQRGLNASLSIHGQQTPSQRLYARNQFQSDRERVIVCNTSAGGVSVSLHDIRGDYPRTAIIMPSTKIIDLIQATGRVHRANGKTDSRQYIPYVAGGLMEGMVRKMRQQMGAVAKLNDGADGSPAL